MYDVVGAPRKAHRPCFAVTERLMSFLFREDSISLDQENIQHISAFVHND